MTVSAKGLIARATGAAAIALTIVSCTDATSVTSPSVGASPTSPSNPAAANLTACSVEQGQQLINAGKYKQAIQKFTCVIDQDPTAVEGYRGRIEAELLLGRFSDALRDYTRVTAFVLPVHPDAQQVIVNGYKARLAANPGEVTALVGLSFAHWYGFAYPAAIHVLNDLLAAQPNHVYGNLFQGSSRVLQGAMRAAGAADLERAIALSPSSPDVRFIVADAYTYGSLRDPQRAFDEATLALQGGLDTPRVRAIRASSYTAFGDIIAAAHEIKRHLDLVTTELVATAPLAPGSTTTLGLVPGRTYEIPIAAAAGETISIATSSKDFWDTILVLLSPGGSPVVGSDDAKAYFAGIKWVAPMAGTYRMRVTSFEAVNTGALVVSRN